MKMTQTGGDVSFEWESYEDFEKEIPELLTKHNGAGKRHMHDNIGHGGSDYWLGTHEGWRACLKKISTGWPELRTSLSKLMEGVELELPVFPTLTHVRRRKRHFADHGDTLHMTKVWNGELDRAWQRPERVERLATNMKRITLAFDVTANASVSNAKAMWRAALCMLLVDSLARAGRTFEIYIIDSTSRPFDQWATFGSFLTNKPSGKTPHALWSSWCVKKANDPINMDRLCSMVSVGYMRTAGFLAMSAGPWIPANSMGSALNSGLPHSLRDREKDGEVVMRIGQCHSKAEALYHYKQVWQELEARVEVA